MVSQTESKENVDKFMQIIRRYTNLETLTAQLVNELIDKIIVHHISQRGVVRIAKWRLNFTTDLSENYETSERKFARNLLTNRLPGEGWLLFHK